MVTVLWTATKDPTGISRFQDGSTTPRCVRISSALKEFLSESLPSALKTGTSYWVSIILMGRSKTPTRVSSFTITALYVWVNTPALALGTIRRLDKIVPKFALYWFIMNFNGKKGG